MLMSAKSYDGYTLLSKDGELGSVRDLFFDEASFTIRYLVVHTGLWPYRKHVLISPASVIESDPIKHRFVVNLSKEDIKKSPQADHTQPLSRHFEQRFHDHFNWPYYWLGPNIWGPVHTPGHLSAMDEEGELRRVSTANLDSEEEIRNRLSQEGMERKNLYSTNEVNGYQVTTADREAGHIDDYIIQEENWKICYLVVDTARWMFGRTILVPTEKVDQIDALGQLMSINLSYEELSEAPDFDPDEAPLNEAKKYHVDSYFGKIPQDQQSPTEPRRP